MKHTVSSKMVQKKLSEKSHICIFHRRFIVDFVTFGILCKKCDVNIDDPLDFLSCKCLVLSKIGSNGL